MAPGAVQIDGSVRADRGEVVAHALQPVSVPHTEYSIFERELETSVLPVPRELHVRRRVVLTARPGL